MKAEQFRELALALPEATEGAHMDHPDFRVRGKIFATLGADGTWGMVKLTPAQQADFVRARPEVFERIDGAWGARGATKVCLSSATQAAARRALIAAWRNTAPKRLARELGEE